MKSSDTALANYYYTNVLCIRHLGAYAVGRFICCLDQLNNALKSGTKTLGITQPAYRNRRRRLKHTYVADRTAPRMSKLEQTLVRESSYHRPYYPMLTWIDR